MAEDLCRGVDWPRLLDGVCDTHHPTNEESQVRATVALACDSLQSLLQKFVVPGPQRRVVWKASRSRGDVGAG